MNLFTFEDPIIEKDLIRPTPIAGQLYPYNQIANPRRFEELLYGICKVKIADNDFGGFDEVSLMSGVADRGRDCALFKKGKAHGLIQCKKYASNYSKEDFGLEITKFVLNSLLDRRLIYDKEDFIYYIAVSTAFTADCSEFIDDFQNNIQNEPNLDRWIQQNLKAPTLQPLNLQDRTQEVKEILSSILVRKLIPQDIDIFLNEPSCQKVVSLFFEVRTVTDNTKIDLLIDSINGGLAADKIIKELHTGSVGLKSERNEFEGIEHSHIERDETEELLQWILADPARNGKGKPLNICLLSGQAGYGKTVILRDLYHKISSKNIPVLGLKADKLYSYSIFDLQRNIGLSVPVYEFFEAAERCFPLTVILVDQIDALSQSISSDRSFLNIFKALIDNFANKENIKIVISVRTNDLYYDPSLRVYKDVKTVSTKLLTESQVLEQLSKIGVVKEQISHQLLELLKTPNHLNVFSRIASNDNKSFQAVTVQDLYFELWDNKIKSIPNTIRVEPVRVKEVLYRIAGQMFQSQRITVSVYHFEEYGSELEYLKSELLIKEEGKHLQFFHQSFYDFIFSKQFVERESDLFTYIIEAEQSIHIRSAVKMISGYLRDFDSDLYIRMMDRILWDDQILFHIKHILLSTIFSQDAPTRQEKRVVLRALRESIYFETLFFEQARAKVWFEFCIENSLLNFLKTIESTMIGVDSVSSSKEELAYLKQVGVGFLRNYILNDIVSEAWEFAKEIGDQSIIRNLLYSVKNWSNHISYELFNSCSDFEEIDSFGYYHVLDNISKINIEFVLEKIKKSLIRNYQSDKRAREYDERTLLENLAKSNPDRLFPILFDIIRPDIEKTILVEDEILSDFKYRSIDLDDDHLERGEFLYRLLAVSLRRSAASKAIGFCDFLDAHKSSERYSVLRLLVFGLTGNEKLYKDEIFDLFTYFMKSRGKDFDSRLGFEVRVLFGQSFPFFDKVQTGRAVQMISNVTVADEIYYYIDTDSQKRKIHSIWGQTKYNWLLRLPKDFLLTNSQLQGQFQELERRYPYYKDKAPKSYSMGGVYSPIPVKAHSYMGKENWLASFRKYNKKRDRAVFNSFKGGLNELASAFQIAVKENPTIEKLDIIKSSIADPNIDIKYSIYGLRGWSESDGDKALAIPLFIDLLEKDNGQYLRDLVDIAANLIGEDKDDKDVINFLVITSLKLGKGFPKKQSSQSNIIMNYELAMAGISVPYGSAIRALVHVKDPEFKDLIFNTFEKVLFEGPSEARAAALFQFAYLMNLDQDRAFDLFALSVNSETDIDVLASALWSLSYMGNYRFDALCSAYSKMAVSDDLGDQDSHSLFIQLYGAYLHNQPKAESLVYTLLDNNRHSCAGAVSDIIKHYYLLPDSKEKNDLLLDYVLSKSVQEDYERLSWSFLNADHLKLNDIHSFLTKYIQSKYFAITEYFLDYLTMQCSEYPFIAIELFELAIKREAISVDKRFGFSSDNSAIKFIVGAFNALNENDDASRSQRRKLLMLFDTVLIDYRFKNNAEKILEELL